MELFRFVLEPTPNSSSSSFSDSSPQQPPSVADHSVTLSTTETVPRVRRRPIPRKGHTKSRNGCLNCKKRKVKCQETLPECNHCQRIGLKCEYPPEQQSHPAAVWLSSPSRAPQTITFTSDDMRFFQHFLFKAYPSLPIHGEGIWRDVAQISHGFDYLIHSMLGLAASALALDAGAYSASHTPAALSHRVIAIRLLNKSLSKPCSCLEEGTARYAAMMVLTFQSAYMADGMLEFLSMTRGCSIVAETAMGGSYEASPFGAFSREEHVDAVRRLGPKPVWEVDGQEDEVLGQEVVGGLLEGLRDLMTVCGGRSRLEDEVMKKVQQAVALARWECVRAFDEVTVVYALLGSAGHEDFFVFVDPANFPAQILLIYFVLVEYMVANHAMGSIRSTFAYRTATTKLWIDNLAAKLPKEYERYMEGPVEFAKSLA